MKEWHDVWGIRHTLEDEDKSDYVISRIEWGVCIFALVCVVASAFYNLVIR